MRPIKHNTKPNQNKPNQTKPNQTTLYNRPTDDAHAPDHTHAHAHAHARYDQPHRFTSRRIASKHHDTQQTTHIVTTEERTRHEKNKLITNYNVIIISVNP